MSSSRSFPSLPAPCRSAARLFAALAAFAVVSILGACASAPAASPPDALFADARFAPPVELIDPGRAFAPSPAMRAYVQDLVDPGPTPRNPRLALADALFRKGGLRLDYDASATRDAAGAFDARMGNCLSLVLMTAAFADLLGLDVTFQQVDVGELWSRASDMYVLNGHVNIVLGRRIGETAARYDSAATVTIDFLPDPASNGLSSRAIDRRRVLAMYLNNRAAEALAAGQVDDAYWRARQAIAADPGFLSAYNTLGVVYLRHGDTAQAETTLRHVATLAPSDPHVLANHADALQRLGRLDEARAERARLATLEPEPPFYFFERGRAALQAGDAVAARQDFLRELARQPDYHEFHFWLALAELRLGEVDSARRELALARDDAPRRSDRDLYTAKLDRLRALPAGPRIQ